MFIPDTQINLCSFHWKQCLLREVGAKGLKQTLNDSVEFDIIMRMLYVIQYVPIGDLLVAWRNVIMQEFNNERENLPAGVKGFLDYIQRNYIGIFCSISDILEIFSYYLTIGTDASV